MAGKHLTKRRTRRVVLLVLAAGIGYGVLRIVLFATGKPTVAVDYAVQYNELVRPANYDPNADAAADYKEAFALLPTIPDGVNPLGHLGEYDPASAEYRTLESWLASCEPAIDLLHKAAAKPCFWGRVSGSDPNLPLPLDGFDFGMFTQASHCLRYRTEYLAAHGSPAQASRCIATGLRMAGHLNDAGRQYLIPGQIVEMIVQRAAFDLLAQTEVDAALLADAQKQLEEILAARTTPSLGSHAIVLRDVIQRSFTDDGKNDGHVLFHTIRDYFKERETPTSELGADFAYLRHFWIAWSHPSRHETIQTIDRLTEAADQFIQQTPWERHTQGVDSFERLRDLCNQNAFLRIASADRTLSWAIVNHYRNLTSMEGLVATMGILRFHKERGSWPATLEELASAGYIRRMPMDPYGGKPLGYVRTTDSFILYSCGDNFCDDGGVPKDPRPAVMHGDWILWPVGERKN